MYYVCKSSGPIKAIVMFKWFLKSSIAAFFNFETLFNNEIIVKEDKDSVTITVSRIGYIDIFAVAGKFFLNAPDTKCTT